MTGKASDAEIISVYRATGSSVQAICNALHVGSRRVKRLIDAAGLPRKRNKFRNLHPVEPKPKRRYRRRKGWCWECGLPVPHGEIFCCDDHRREYGYAAVRPGFNLPPSRKVIHYAQAPYQASPSENGYRSCSRYFG